MAVWQGSHLKSSIKMVSRRSLSENPTRAERPEGCRATLRGSSANAFLNSKLLRGNYIIDK